MQKEWPHGKTIGGNREVDVRELTLAYCAVREAMSKGKKKKEWEIFIAFDSLITSIM